MTVITLPPHLSYSQVDTLNRCGASWFFQRGLKIRGETSWAQVGGTALHTATEWWDLEAIVTGDWDASPDRLRALWGKAFALAVDEATAREGTEPEQWRATGRATKANPNKRDRAWWDANGPVYLHRYATWRQVAPYDITEIEGFGPAVEVPCSVTIGGVKVEMFIDRVFTAHDKSHDLIVDIKSGEHVPADTLQLGTYGAGLRDQWGVDATWASYWMAGTGGTTAPVSMSTWPLKRLNWTYSKAREAQAGGQFPPRRSPMCSGCSVREYCAAYGGALAWQTPQPWDVTEVRVPDSEDSK